MAPYELRPISKVYSGGSGKIAKLVYCPSLNHFILVDDQGRFLLADGNGEVVYGPVTDGDSASVSKISIDYANFHNCLLAWDGERFNVRRDLGGSWLLKTILAGKCETASDEDVAIELTLNEAAKLLHYLSAPTVKLSCSNDDALAKILSDLRACVEEAKEAEKLSRGQKWATVLLRGPFNFLLSTFNSALTDLKQSSLRLPIVPVLSAVIERLNLLKEQPFSFDSVSEAAGIDKSVMASEAARRLTFCQWPHMDYKWALPDQMAEAGFYHQPNTGGDDRVFCFTCTVCLVCWEPADEPWSEHERHSPTCAFVRGEYTQNVPVSVTYASSPALPCGCADEVTCVSKLSYCDWIASSTRYGEVVLWNIAKDLKKCDPVSLDPSEPFLEMKTGYRCRPRRHLKSGVAWADEADMVVSQGISASPSSVGQESIREAIEPGNNEISSEIVAICPQKGDLIVTAVCTCGEPMTKRTISEMLAADSQCSAALIVGCGITESKLRMELRITDAASPTSFVENLNTVNKAASTFNECILPPSKGPTGLASPSFSDEQDSQTGPTPPRYRPFILVYKIDDSLEEPRESQYTEKSRRSGTSHTPAVSGDKSTLASVKEIDELAHSLQDDVYEEIENLVDEKEAAMDAAESVDEDAIAIGGIEKSAFAQQHQQLQAKMAAMQQATSSAVSSQSTVSIPFSDTVNSGTSVVESIPYSTDSMVTMKTAIGYDEALATVQKTSEEIFIKGAPRPLKASLTILQCIRMPAQLDSSFYYIQSIVPSLDGLFVFVVVNRHETVVVADKESEMDGGGIQSAIMTYRLTFSCHMTSLVEQPYRQINLDGEMGPLETVVPLQAGGSNEECRGSNLLAILTRRGDVRVVNADNGATVAKHAPPTGKIFTSICGYQEDKLCVGCDDGSISTMELARTDITTSETENLTQSPVDDANEWKDPDLLVNKPLGLDVLKELWQLTRSDWATSGQFSMQAPSAWVEVQQHQRLRKNPQHYLREEKLAKSWHLVPDNDTWFEHIFEITLPGNFSASHVDFRFVLHRSASGGMPPIQVTFLRQLPTTASRSTCVTGAGGEATASSAMPQDAPTTSTSTLEPETEPVTVNRVFDKHFLENLHADVIAGPFDLQTALDLYDLNGVIQFSSSELNSSKLRTFFIHIQALSKAGTPDPNVKRSSSFTVSKIQTSGNNATIEKGTSGFYQQKSAYNKYGFPTGKVNVRVIPTRNLADGRKMEDLKGCDWIQEVSVTVWRSKRTALKKEKKQRLALTKNTDFTINLVKTLESGLSDSKTAVEVDAAVCKRYLILDLLAWIIHQGSPENRRMIDAVVGALEKKLEQMIRSCYVYSNRTVARKFTALTAGLLSKMKTLDAVSFSGFVDSLKNALRCFVFTIGAYRNSASALWLLALAEETYKLSPTGSSSFISEMQEFACIVGKILKQQSTMYRKAFPSQYGSMASPFELEMFEIPPPVLLLQQRAQQPFTYAAVTTAGMTVTANFCSDVAQEENDWLEMAGVDYTAPNTVSVRAQRRGRIIRLEREHLYGLIEVEPLQFVCYSASDGIKIENLDTGVSVAVAGCGNVVPTSTGAGPIPLPDMTQYEQSGNPALTSAVTSMKQQVQSILSKQMQLLAIQQQKQKLQVKLTDHVEKLASLAADQVPATQASSASTFGVPTTPKTTPFMTPTPLSPSHLSPINSEVDLRFDDDAGDSEEREYAAESLERQKKLVPAEFLKPPPSQALVVERMSSGARKFVVLNFDQPVLLTDLVIPQCGDIGSLSIDVWLKSEGDDGQRLVVCNDISQKTLVLCDLQPACLCQYLKITYIGRQGLGSCTSKIPLGNFYGHTYATPSQLVMVDGVNNGRSFEDVKSLRRPSLSVEQLRQLEEDVRCRYNLACDQLRSMLDSPESLVKFDTRETQSAVIREMCREISSIRIQWNLLHRAIDRIGISVVAGQRTHNLDGGMEIDVGYDKARVVSELIFGTIIRMSPLMKLDVDNEYLQTLESSRKSVLSLETAVDVFERFCNSGVPSLTAMSVVWILHHGAYTNWWGAFFGVILDKFFSSENDLERTRRLFLILSFLVDRGLASGNNTVFLTFLHRLNAQLLEDISNDVTWSFQLTLMLLSHCFDTFMHGRMVGSRWDFLLGEYSKKRHSSPKTDNDGNNNAGQTIKLGTSFGYPKDAIQQSEELIAQHHQKVVQLSSELKEIVKSKPTKTALLNKHKTPSPGPYALMPNSTFSSGSVEVKSTDAGTRQTSVSVEQSAPTVIRSTSSSHKKQRLKLPYELCLMVSRKLASVLLCTDVAFSAEVFILICKVLSSITRCSRPLLHMCDVFAGPDQIYALIRNTVVSRNDYVRRALICLAQDLLACEAKCENARNAVATTKRTTSPTLPRSGIPAPGSESSGASVESDLEARANAASASKQTESTGVKEAEENLAKALIKFTKDKQTAAVSPGETATASTSAVFQGGTEEGLDTSTGAMAYIESIVEMIKPIPVTNSKIMYEKRQERLCNMCREVLFTNAAKSGLTWLHDAKAYNEYIVALTKIEQNLAKILPTEAQYDTEMAKLTTAFIETNDLFTSVDDSKTKTVDLDDEYLTAAGASLAFQASEWDNANNLTTSVSNFGSVTPVPFTPPIDPSSYYSTIAAPLFSGQNLAEAKDALWKLCEQLHASAAKVSNVYSTFSDVGPPPPPPPLSSLTANNSLILDLGPLSESMQITASGNDGPLLWDEDSDSEGTPMEPEAVTPFISYFVAATGTNPPPPAPAHLWKQQESYSAPKIQEKIPTDGRLSAALASVQPISLALDERMESQLGWQAEVWIRRWLLINNSALRSSLQAASSFWKPMAGASFVQQRDQRTSHNHISSSAAISDAFTKLFDSLTSSTSATFVESILDSCWLLSIKTESKTQEIPVVATGNAIVLGEQPIKKLLSWLLEGIGISERIWCLALRILAVSVRSKTIDRTPSDSVFHSLFVTDDPNFSKVLRRLLTKVRVSGVSELAGPAIAQAFSDLLTCINLHLNGLHRQYADRFREMLVKLILDLLSERDLGTIGQLPLDLINKLVEFLLNYAVVWRLDHRLVADLASSLSLNLRDYLLNCDPSTEAVLANGSANPRYCFVVGKPDLTTNEFRCFHDRLDVVMVNLLKLGGKLLNCSEPQGEATNVLGGTTNESLTDDAKAGASGNNGIVVEAVLDSRSSFLDNILHAIGLCCGGVSGKTEDTTSNDFTSTTPVTAADASLQFLFALINRANNDQLASVLEGTVNFLRASNSDYSQTKISDLSVFVYQKIFAICATRNESAFGETGVVAVMAEQLITCYKTIDPVPVADYSHLLKSAAAVCGRGPKPTDTTSKKLSDVKVDGMTNFAPLCSISSSMPMAHHLTSLLNSTPPHRRARSAAWSYHFYPAETWLDVTLTLPYSVILKEIQIRPHLASLQSCPSALQVELSPDSNLNSLRALAPPLLTSGCTKIRVSTECFGSPVRMIRLHFKRPVDSTNLGMSQILLLGHSPLSNETQCGDQRFRWLQLLHHTLGYKDGSLWQARSAPLLVRLCDQLVRMFLTAPMSDTAYAQLVDVFDVMEGHCGQAGPFRKLLERLGAKDCSYQMASLVWVAEAVWRLCRGGYANSDNRISMLVQWIQEALEGYCAGRWISVPLLKCVIWSCSCVLWRLGQQNSGKKIPVRMELIRILHKCSRDVDEIELSRVCGYLLCSVIRTYPEHLDEILRLCGLGNFASSAPSNITDELKGAKFTNDQHVSQLNQADLRVLALASQSSLTVMTLQSHGVLVYLVNILTSLCVEGGNNLEVIVAIVDLLNDIATQPSFKMWLTTSEGTIFWAPLLTYIALSPSRVSAPMDTWRQLESATVSFLRRCISCHQDSQQLVSTLIAQLLTSISGGLNSSLQQLILRVLLEDEKLTVATEDAKLIRNGFQIWHPQFGCSIHIMVREVSIYASCAQLLPDATDQKLLKNGKKVSYGLFSDASDASKVFSGDPLTSITYAGEKAKANRIALKSAHGESKGESTGKLSASTVSTCPVAYIAHEYFGRTNALPGKLTVGQLYCKLLSMGEDIDSLSMRVQYGLPGDGNAIVNDGLLQSLSPRSTLEVFARQGGLALLAEHLQLYQPTVSVQNFRPSGGTFSDNEMKILEDMQASASKPFLNDPEMMDYYDPSYEWVNVASSGAEGYIVEAKPHVSGCMRSVVSMGLSPHVVVCFGVFLRLPGYAELLVTQDRRQAQWLLRLAMGITTDSLGVNIINNAEASSMGVLPFEILSSLYRACLWNNDEGRMIRTTSIDLGIPQLLLRCLAAFSHHNERRAVPVEEKPEVVRIVDQLLATLAYAEQPGFTPTTTDEKSHLYWAKGTGFGTGSTQQHWNVDLHIVKQKQDEQSVACLLKVLAQFIYPGDLVILPVQLDDNGPSTSAGPSVIPDDELMSSQWAHFVRLAADSCLVPTLQSYLRNDSVLDISRHVTVYESVMRILCSLALCRQLCVLLTEVDDQQQSPKSLLKKLKQCVDIYISKLEPLKKTGEGMGSEEAATEEGLLKLVPLIEQTSHLIRARTADSDLDDTATKGRRPSAAMALAASLSEEQEYMRVMKTLQFDSFKFLKPGVNGGIRFVIPYHYEASVQGAGKDISALAPCVRRLAQEAVTLSSSLPLSYSSSVFVRTAEERLDLMKVLITGPCDTPYANGCFEFDVWFPSDYPTSPMHINLQTTGGSTVRFNPNLYNDGKVCLSILNTWHGRPEERWNAQTSSFLQVLVSIQSLILVSDPYFNEPGYERSRGTPAGQHASREYDANIRQATVRWAMLEMLRNPPACFKEVIHRHFWLKRDEITKQIETWIAEMDNGSSAGADKRIQRNLLTHLTSLKRHFSALKEEFAKMTHPAGLENECSENAEGCSVSKT